jgi:hypothetical protein
MFLSLQDWREPQEILRFYPHPVLPVPLLIKFIQQRRKILPPAHRCQSAVLDDIQKGKLHRLSFDFGYHIRLSRRIPDRSKQPLQKEPKPFPLLLCQISSKKLLSPAHLMLYLPANHRRKPLQSV